MNDSALSSSDPSEPAPQTPAEKNRSRYERREQASADALRGLLRDMVHDKFPALVTEARSLPLTLHLTLTTGEPGELAFTPDLRHQILEQAAELLSPRDAYREGSVYDFHSQSVEAPACRPPDAVSVFAGFDSMGQPTWSPLTQLFIDRGDSRVDRLGKTPCALFIPGKELREGQLSSFGKSSRAYSLLAQLCFGFLSVPAAYRDVAGGERLALTVQVVETRDERGRFALRLNVLTGRLLPDEWTALLQENAFHGVRDALKRTRAELSRLEERAVAALARGHEDDYRGVMKKIPSLLHKTASWLERPSAKSGRQKTHPHLKRDLESARLQDLFHDEERASWILLGNGPSAHVFSKKSEYVTSFKADSFLVEQRITSRRWRLATEEDQPVLQRLKSRL